MDEPNEPRADAKLQNIALQDQEFADDMWRFRFPEKGGKKLTYVKILVQVRLRCGFEVSLSTLHSFYRWLKLHRRFQEQRRAVDQLKAELAQDPEISEEQVEKAGRVMFMTEGMINQDPKVFANMVKIGHGRVKLQQADVKLELSKEMVAMDQRKLALLEAKAAKADAAESVAKNGAMSTEEKQSRMKEIFGF